MDTELKNNWARLEESFHSDRAKGIAARIQIEVEDGEDYFLIIQDAQLTAGRGRLENPRLTLQANTADLTAIFNGKLDPSSAFFQGKLRLRGDINLAMKVIKLFKD